MKKICILLLVMVCSLSAIIAASPQILTELSAGIFGAKRYLYLAGAEYVNTRDRGYAGIYHSGFYNRLLGFAVSKIADDFETDTVSSGERQLVLNQAKALFASKSAIKALYNISEQIILDVIQDYDIRDEVLEDLALFEKNVSGDFPENFFAELKRRETIFDSLFNVQSSEDWGKEWEARSAAVHAMEEWTSKNHYNPDDYSQAQKYPGLREGTLWAIGRLRSRLQ